jgi:ferrous iron transport protein B
MARAAFIMDKVMSKCGLSGKSFIPMLSGFACAVPAIMAARVIESRRDRIATILVIPLMTCSARLPVYAILIGTFIPDVPLVGRLLGLQAATLFGLYVLGIVVAVAMAWVFKKTILRGATPPFVLELPSYKIPALGTVLLRLYDRAKAFLLRAGTIILTITIIVWALSYFPRSDEIAASFAQQRQETLGQLEALAGGEDARRTELEERISRLDKEEAGAYLRQSYFGRMGHFVAPVFEPLGWDWKISMAAVASFPAREVVVSTLGTIYNFEADAEEEPQQLGERLREERWPDSDRPVFTIPVALSIMVFFALCCQCGATVATIQRETSSWGWAWFTFAYMTGLAYVGALLTFQIGRRFFSGT